MSTSTEPNSKLHHQGNLAFRQGNFQAAICAYTSALQDNNSTAELWSNRAACFLKLGQPYLAAADAYELVDLRPDWPKTYFRLGKASEAMGGYDDALQWYEAGLTIANMQNLTQDASTLQRCIRKTNKLKRKGDTINKELAKEMGFDSDLFYVPCFHFSRKISVSSDTKFFSSLVAPFSISVRDFNPPTRKKLSKITKNAVANTCTSNDVDPPGGGRGLFSATDFPNHTSVFVDEQVLCVSYSPFLCDFCGAALPTIRDAVPAALKSGDVDEDGKPLPAGSFETYCSETCRKAAFQCYFGPSLSAASARAIADLRKQLFTAAMAGEAPLAASYHVMGAIRLGAMILARRRYDQDNEPVPSLLTKKLEVFSKLVCPADLPQANLRQHGFKVPFMERYRQYTQVCNMLGVSRDTELSFEWYDKAWGAMLFNALRSAPDSGVDDDPAVGRITAEDPTGTLCESVSIMAIGSFINHNYKPNVMLRRCKASGPFPTNTFHFVSLRPIAENEELCISYTDPAIPENVQKNILQSQYLIYDPSDLNDKGGEDEAVQGDKRSQSPTSKGVESVARTERINGIETSRNLSTKPTDSEAKIDQRSVGKEADAKEPAKDYRSDAITKKVSKMSGKYPTSLMMSDTKATKANDTDASPNPLSENPTKKLLHLSKQSANFTTNMRDDADGGHLVDNVRDYNVGSLEDDLD